MLKSCGIAAVVSGALIGTPWAAPAPPVQDQAVLLHPDAAAVNQEAPAHFIAHLDTSKGVIEFDCTRDWAPHGADRFYNLIRAGYYDDVYFTRVVKDRWAQFGINGTPAIANAWRSATFPDDPFKHTNARGTIAFAFAVKNGRTTQVFINLRDNSATHDIEPFVPFGNVSAGMDVVDALYNGYGDNAGGGIRGGKQDPLFEGGNAFIAQTYPKLDHIIKATIR
jgi:cyclophilin family peptidyl-prolyl cis-trans isomerase